MVVGPSVQAAAEAALRTLQALDAEHPEPSSEAESSADPIARFRQAVAAKQQSGMDFRTATKAVCLEDPDLHHSYVVAATEARYDHKYK